MNKQQQKPALVATPVSTSDYTRKIAMTVGGAALGLTGLADAGIIHHTGGGAAFTVEGSSSSSVDWDIDASGGAEFTLSGFNQTSPYFSSTYFYNSAIIAAQGSSDKLFGTYSDLTVFGSGDLIGPTGSPSLTSSALLFATGITVSTVGAGGSIEDKLIGFQFLKDSILLFGWANFRFDSSHPGSVEITEWAYCDGNGCSSIEAGVAPVPEPAVPSLLLLGMGAAGVARWKKNKRDAS